jgi:hypothetical protein
MLAFMPNYCLSTGRSYSHLELRSNQFGNGYEAVISEGMSAETVPENPTPFPLVSHFDTCVLFACSLVDHW